ncbi:MAG: flavodoxin domain-containing protein [Saprospiraceae bacterium]
MKAAILFTGWYGSTKQYADWIAEATGYPVYNLDEVQPDLDNFDLIILGSSIVIGKLTIRKWVKLHWPELRNKELILFTVSGTAPGHPDLHKYLEASLPVDMIDQMDYIPLRGRLIIKELKWYTRLLLRLGARQEKDPEAKKRMLEGFDFVKRENIEPILELVEIDEAAPILR